MIWEQAQEFGDGRLPDHVAGLSQLSLSKGPDGKVSVYVVQGAGSGDSKRINITMQSVSDAAAMAKELA